MKARKVFYIYRSGFAGASGATVTAVRPVCLDAAPGQTCRPRRRRLLRAQRSQRGRRPVAGPAVQRPRRPGAPKEFRMFHSVSSPIVRFCQDSDILFGDVWSRCTKVNKVYQNSGTSRVCSVFTPTFHYFKQLIWRTFSRCRSLEQVDFLESRATVMEPCNPTGNYRGW